MTDDAINSFSSFGLSETMLEALERRGFSTPTSVQAIALPRLLADQGHLIVKARTGTGKTAAFGIPLVERLTTGGHAPRALILTPTRELALQVSREIASLKWGQFPRITAVYGGASIRNQILDLKRGTEVVVGTPGRIMDLMERKVLDLSAVDWFILDEADEMLDMGFFEDVETILAQVKNERRVALFSATMPEAILKVVREHIGQTEILEDTAPEDEKPAVDQFYVVLKKEDRLEALRRIIDQADDFYGLVFCATKSGTDELARRLVEGGYPAEAIHGDLSQEARERTLRRFRSRQTTILVATDVAARGLDIERLTHVINWDLPQDRDTYVHRIGRTGRAGQRGKAVSLALPAERGKIDHLSRSMERTLGSGIQWMKVPSVKSVMKALRGRIAASVMNALPREEELPPEADVPEDTEAALYAAAGPIETGQEEDGGISPFLSKLCRQLTEELGPERALMGLLNLKYGDLLDPSRYGAVTELPEIPPREEARSGGKWGAGRKSRFERHSGSRPGAYAERLPLGESQTRVYVGIGRRHGIGARDVADLLMRAGGVPGRMVDAIEVRDYCAFASMPSAAAKRACVFSRNAPDDPAIRLASPKESGR
ncbi:MAG: DEAD/DEAH box helicase [Treponema sp.]|nr:DEAD/DEAH box helicase [Treponema sp.]